MAARSTPRAVCCRDDRDRANRTAGGRAARALANAGTRVDGRTARDVAVVRRRRADAAAPGAVGPGRRAGGHADRGGSARLRRRHRGVRAPQPRRHRAVPAALRDLRGARGGGENAALLAPIGFAAALGSRFLVGMFLAGVYPPSMKMIATWFRRARARDRHRGRRAHRRQGDAVLPARARRRERRAGDDVRVVDRDRRGAARRRRLPRGAVRVPAPRVQLEPGRHGRSRPR